MFNGKTVLITGGTGRIGKEIIARLKQGGLCSSIVATSHNPDKADYLKALGATELVKFDYEDESNWSEVLDGVNVTWPFAPKHLNPSMNANTYVGSVATSGFDSDRPAGCVAELGTDEVQLNMYCATGNCGDGFLNKGPAHTQFSGAAANGYKIISVH